MNYNLERIYYDDKNVDLSNKLTSKDWRKIRNVHMSCVIHYDDEKDNKLYQCSKCKTFHDKVDMHDHWVHDSITERRFDSLDNLCFVCHAMEHLDRMYTLDMTPKLSMYRGIRLEDLEKTFDQKCKLLYNTNFKSKAQEVLSKAKKMKDYLDETGLKIKNDYRLLQMLNETLWEKSPIKI